MIKADPRQLTLEDYYRERILAELEAFKETLSPRSQGPGGAPPGELERSSKGNKHDRTSRQDDRGARPRNRGARKPDPRKKPEEKSKKKKQPRNQVKKTTNQGGKKCGR